MTEGWLAPPPEVVAPDCIAGVVERIDRDGQVVVPLDRSGLLTAARHLVEDRGVEALAVSFLWSFRNAEHEELAAALLAEAYPGLPVVSGAALIR